MGYADNLLIVARGPFLEPLTGMMQEPLKLVVEWSDRTGIENWRLKPATMLWICETIIKPSLTYASYRGLEKLRLPPLWELQTLQIITLPYTSKNGYFHGVGVLVVFDMHCCSLVHALYQEYLVLILASFSALDTAYNCIWSNVFWKSADPRCNSMLYS